MIRRIRLHGRRGGAEIFLVLLVAAAAAAFLLHHYRGLERAAVSEQREADGRIFAAWAMAAHRATMEIDYAAAMPGGQALSQAALRSAGMAPPGLPEGTRHGTVFLGVIDDDLAATPDVPMAFAVLRVAGDEKVPAVARGALHEGLAFVERVGDGGPMADRHRVRIETLLGAALGAEDLLVTADLGIRVDPSRLYRRAQPGKPWLAAMETDLDMSDAGDVRRAMTGVHALETASATTVADASADSAAATADVAAATAAAGTMTLTSLSAGSVRVIDSLLIRGDVFLSGQATGEADASTPGRAQAGMASVTGAVNAGSLAAAAELATPGTLDVTGTMTASSGEGSPAVTTATATLGGLYGPTLTATTITVTGSCRGCEEYEP